MPCIQVTGTVLVKFSAIRLTGQLQKLQLVMRVVRNTCVGLIRMENHKTTRDIRDARVSFKISNRTAVVICECPNCKRLT